MNALLKEESLELHMQAGALLRLAKETLSAAYVNMSKFESEAQLARLKCCTDYLDSVCCIADEGMFTDHPEIGEAYKDVYYGNLHDEPRTDVDAEVIARAHAFTEGLFEKH